MEVLNDKHSDLCFYYNAPTLFQQAGIEEGNSSSGVELSNGCGIMYFIGSPLSRVFVHQKATIDEACRVRSCLHISLSIINFILNILCTMLSYSYDRFRL